MNTPQLCCGDETPIGSRRSRHLFVWKPPRYSAASCGVGFIALFNPADTLCKKAEDLSQKLYKEGYSLVFSNFIFLEVVTVLSQKKGRRGSVEAGMHLLTHPSLEYVHVDESTQGETWDIFRQVKNKNVSFVDCSIIACMQTEGICKLLTFDKKDFTILQREFSFSFYQ